MSPAYHVLCRRLAKLCKHLLPSIDPTGSYSDEEYDKTRGLIALIHAEIESYVETRCLEIAQSSFDIWLTTRIPNSVVFGLYTMSYTGWSALGGIDGAQKASNQNDLECRLGFAKTQYEKVIGDNNGIKAENLKKMLVPLSIRIKADLDPDWIIAMSNFGGDRGKVVHMSWKANIPPDPGDLGILLRKTLLPGLKILDTKMNSLVDPGTTLLSKKPLLDRLRIAARIIFAS